MMRIILVVFLCSTVLHAPLYADQAEDVVKVKQVMKTAFRNGVAPSNFDGLTYAYWYQGDYLVYGYRQFCTDIAVTGITPFECSSKTYGTLTLENKFRSYLDPLVTQGYVSSYRFDKPYWNDGMGGATLWTIYVLPGNSAADDSQAGKATYQKVKDQQSNSNSGSTWQTDMQSNVSDLKTLIESEKKKQEEQEKQQQAFEQQMQRQADELNPDIADAQQRLKDEQKAADQNQNNSQNSKDIFNK